MIYDSFMTIEYFVNLKLNEQIVLAQLLDVMRNNDCIWGLQPDEANSLKLLEQLEGQIGSLWPS